MIVSQSAVIAPLPVLGCIDILRPSRRRPGTDSASASRQQIWVRRVARPKTNRAAVANGAQRWRSRSPFSQPPPWGSPLDPILGRRDNLPASFPLPAPSGPDLPPCWVRKNSLMYDSQATDAHVIFAKTPGDFTPGSAILP